MNRRSPASLRELVDLAMSEAGVQRGRELDRVIVRQLGEEHRVSHTIINAILAGRYHSTPTPATVRSLATIARVPEGVAFAAAGIERHEPFELPDSAGELTGDQREAVLAVVRAFAKANRGSGTDTDRNRLRPAASRRRDGDVRRSGDP